MASSSIRRYGQRASARDGRALRAPHIRVFTSGDLGGVAAHGGARRLLSRRCRLGQEQVPVGIGVRFLPVVLEGEDLRSAEPTY